MSEPEQSTSNSSVIKNSITPSTSQQVPLKILAIGSAYEDTILYVDKFPPEDGKQRAQRVEKRRGGNSDFEARNIKTTTCIFRPSATHAPVAYIIHADNTGRNAAEEAKMIEYIDTKDWRDKAIISVEFEKPFRRGLEVLIDKADVLFFSKVFAEGKGYDHADEFLQIMSPYCKETALLFCTWGSAGAMCFHNPTKKFFSAPALAISSVVDSVGAGDTFNAGAIYGLSQGMPPESCLKFSCELAGRKCAQNGFDGVVEKMKLAAMKKEENAANKQMI
ncbi:12334_t:CDS:2 [Racocetra fulgida]|uniref:12334_t:CDS:1 n=1 Tax=Racocetra fulgida TaxID=60492 RepID=A0A9N8VQP0_9GLOM|nr:12334_t:CDS:2 [Racocetra fulgida]